MISEHMEGETVTAISWNDRDKRGARISLWKSPMNNKYLYLLCLEISLRIYLCLMFFFCEKRKEALKDILCDIQRIPERCKFFLYYFLVKNLLVPVPLPMRGHFLL